MGRSYTPKYRIEVGLAGAFRADSFAWKTADYGRVSAANLTRFVEAHNASLESGGANAHLEAGCKIVTAVLVRQSDDVAVASYPRAAVAY